MKAIIFWAVVLFLISFSVGIYSKFLIAFFSNSQNTTFFQPIVTLIVGFVALFIYYKQKSDSKKDAANIIYLEIISAERIMKRAKEDLEKKLPSEIALSAQATPTESWSKYKYLFVRDFDPVEWDSISNFYNKAGLFDEAVNHNNSFFHKNEEQIRVNLQRVLADYIKENEVDFSKVTVNKVEEKKWKKLIELADSFYIKFMDRMVASNSLFFYRPDKPVLSAKLNLDNLNLDLSSSSIGLKLKKLANFKE